MCHKLTDFLSIRKEFMSSPRDVDREQFNQNSSTLFLCWCLTLSLHPVSQQKALILSDQKSQCHVREYFDLSRMGQNTVKLCII